MNARVLETIKQSAAVPSMPQVVVRFLEVIQHPDFDYDEVVKVLSTDAGTVSELLRLANSSLFGLAGKVTSLRKALTMLGPKRTRSLVLGRCLVERMNSCRVGTVDITYFWRRSLASAVLSARLADAVVPKMREEAFISALLADIGVPILSGALKEQYEPVAARYCPNGLPVTEDEEREYAGVTHAEVSAMVLAHWGVPETICKAVNLQQSLTVLPVDDATRVARIINAADRIARLLCEIPDDRDASLTCAEAMAFIAVDLGVLVRILGDIEHDVQELAAILRTDVIPSSVYQRIAQAVQRQLCPAPA
jgi:HD-like signal output (HDOD) protein